MATPHVAGAAALYLATHSVPATKAGVQTVESALLANSFAQTSNCGYTSSHSLTVPLLNTGPACPLDGPPPPDFSVSCNPGSLSIPANSNKPATCTVTSINGFNSAVALDCTGLASGVHCGFSPTSVTPPANGTVNSTLTVTVDSNVSGGSHPFNVRATSGSAKTFGMSLNVPDYSVSCNPASLTIQQASNKQTTCTVTSVGGFNSSVALSCSGLPANVSCGFNPASVTPTANSTLTVTVGGGAAPVTNSPFTVNAGSKTFNMSLTVTTAPPPDFSVSCNPNSLSIQTGSNAGTTCTVTSTGGFNSPVALSCSGLATGVTCSYNPSSVTPPSNGSTNSTLTVSVASNVSTGSHNFTVTATNGSTKSFNMSLNVTAPSSCSFFARLFGLC